MGRARMQEWSTVRCRWVKQKSWVTLSLIRRCNLVSAGHNFCAILDWVIKVPHDIPGAICCAGIIMLGVKIIITRASTSVLSGLGGKNILRQWKSLNAIMFGPMQHVCWLLAKIVFTQCRSTSPQYLPPILVDHENVKWARCKWLLTNWAGDQFCDTVSSVSRCDNVKNISYASGLPRESKAWSVYPQVVVLLAPIQILSPGLAILSMSTNQRSFKLFLANQKSSLMYHPH